MKRSTKLLILTIAVIAISSWMITFSYLFFHRYPHESEIRAHLAAETAGKRFTIDSSQEESGLFGIEVEGEEVFYIEAIPKWVFPWDEYEWSSH